MHNGRHVRSQVSKPNINSYLLLQRAPPGGGAGGRGVGVLYTKSFLNLTKTCPKPTQTFLKPNQIRPEAGPG